MVLRPHRDGLVMKASKRLVIEMEQEVDDRWIGEIPALPGVLAYGTTREEAIAKAKALALRVAAERLEHGEPGPQPVETTSFGAGKDRPS
jgi:predicted RNase H-like HicB family nuclease